MNESRKWIDKAKEYRRFARYFTDNGMVGAAHDSRKDADYCQRKAARERAREQNSFDRVCVGFDGGAA